MKVTAAYLCIRTLNVCRNLIYGSNTGHFFLFDVGIMFFIVTWHNDDGICQQVIKKIQTWPITIAPLFIVACFHVYKYTIKKDLDVQLLNAEHSVRGR